MSILSPQAWLANLSCPNGCPGELVIAEAQALCRTCGQTFAISDDGILEMVRESELDEATAMELRGHEFNLTPLQVSQWVLKKKAMLWRNYYSRNRMRTIQHLAAFLKRVNCEQVFFLGVGTGREIEYLLSWAAHLRTASHSGYPYGGVTAYR